MTSLGMTTMGHPTPPGWCCLTIKSSRVVLRVVTALDLIFGITMIALALAMERLLQLLPLETPQEVRIVQGTLIAQGIAILLSCSITLLYSQTTNIGQLYGVIACEVIVLLLQLLITLMARFFLMVLLFDERIKGTVNCDVCEEQETGYDIIMSYVRPPLIISGITCIGLGLQLSVVVSIKNHFLKTFHREKHAVMNRAFQIEYNSMVSRTLQPRVTLTLDLSDLEKFLPMGARYASTPMVAPRASESAEQGNVSQCPTIVQYCAENSDEDTPKSASIGLQGKDGNSRMSLSEVGSAKREQLQVDRRKALTSVHVARSSPRITLHLSVPKERYVLKKYPASCNLKVLSASPMRTPMRQSQRSNKRGNSVSTVVVKKANCLSVSSAVDQGRQRRSSSRPTSVHRRPAIHRPKSCGHPTKHSREIAMSSGKAKKKKSPQKQKPQKAKCAARKRVGSSSMAPEPDAQLKRVTLTSSHVSQNQNVHRSPASHRSKSCGQPTKHSREIAISSGKAKKKRAPRKQRPRKAKSGARKRVGSSSMAPKPDTQLKRVTLTSSHVSQNQNVLKRGRATSTKGNLVFKDVSSRSNCRRTKSYNPTGRQS